MAMQIIGYPLEVNYCPKCGSTDIISRDNWDMDGKMKCNKCGAIAYIIEGEEED